MPSESNGPPRPVAIDRSRPSHRRFSRRSILASGAALGSAFAAGCIDDGSSIGDDTNRAEVDGDADDDLFEGDETTNVAIVSNTAGFGAGSLNDRSLAGLEAVADDFDVEVNEVEETQESEYESVQADLAESGRYDLVVLVGFEHLNPLERNASAYPDQKWALIQEHVAGADNVSGWIERYDQLSFLAGVAAATSTREAIERGDGSTDPDRGVVGFVGGEDIDLINASEQSYVEGAEWIDEGIEVLVGYAGTFTDEGGPEEAAASQYEAGADVVYHMAAEAGAGTFAAAREAGRFALGSPFDGSLTNDENADVVLGSADLAPEVATAEVAAAVHRGDWTRVAGEQYLSVANAGVDLVSGAGSGGSLPGAVDENLEAAREALVDGDVELTCGPTGC